MEWIQQFSPGTLEWATVAATGGAGACVAFLVAQALLFARAVHQSAGEEVLLTETTSPLMRAFLPLARQIGLAMRALLSGGRVTSAYVRMHTLLERRLSAAGRPQGINADEYMGFYVILILAWGGFGVLSFLAMGENAPMDVYTWFAMGAGMGAVYWFAWLSQAVERHQTQIRKSLPFSLDLLTLAMEAGLDFTTGLSRIVPKMGDNPLGREFSLTLHEIQLGKSRSDALRDMANRVDLQDLRTVVASLVQAEELGSSLGPVLRIQTAQLRERRSQRAEEKAQKTPVKLIFPLVAFLFPATLIMLFGPIVLELL